jgi:hypothetical protein
VNLLGDNIDTTKKDTDILIDASKEAGPEINVEKTLGGGALHPVVRILSRLLEEPSLTTTLQGVYYVFLPLHVSAPAGHLQAEYTIIF